MRVLRVFHSAVVDAWRARERELGKLGNDVHLLTARRWNEGGSDVLLESHLDEQVEGVRTVGRHPALFFYDPRPIWRAMGQKWDVIDIHEEPFALATAEILTIRRLRRNSAPYVLYSAQNLEKRYPIPFRWFERWALRHAAGLQVCNDDAGRIMQRKGFPGQPHTIPLGVDLDHFTPSDQVPDTGGPVQVGYVGRLAPHKGVPVLLDSVAKEPGLHLTLAGSGPQGEELQHLSLELGIADRVTWLGAVSQDDLPGIYTRFDALAVPSLTTPGWVEQFGRVAIEAMASGVPVVASDSGALLDVVSNAGLIVPEGDATALAAALLRVARTPELHRTLRQRGLQRAKQCSWPAVAADFDELYGAATHRPSQEAADLAPEVIVVAFGAPDLLRETLSSIAGLDVTVVDNSSRDDVRDVSESAGARYLDPGHNGGFGTGVNYALARRLTPMSDVLLLNPDARITVQGVQRLHRALRADPTLASVGPAQVDQDGARARVAWPWPTPLRAWIEAVGLGRLNRSGDYVIGSVLMLRAEALAQVGRFDEEFFLYAEETDWERRAAMMGWRHAVVSSVSAVHIGGATSSDPDRRNTHFYAGQERYFRKHHGTVGWQLARAAQWVGAVVRSRLLPPERAAAALARAHRLREGPLRAEAARYPRPASATLDRFAS